jgi:cyclophilin family peptidyl-prolyl cis-trans isomerase
MLAKFMYGMLTSMRSMAMLILAGLVWLTLDLTPKTAYGADDSLPPGLYTHINTEAGEMVAELFYKKTPMTVASYVGLAEGKLGPRKGTPFYEGLKWFRVERNFVIQGGDGGEIGYSFPDEIVPGLRHDGPGTLQMANGGPDTNGSQYCFMMSDQTGLNYNHTVFGHVVRGLDLLPKIKVGDTMHVKILRVGPDAESFQVDQAMFDALVAKAKRYDGPRKPGPDAFLDDPDNLIGTAGRGSTFLQFKLANFERFTGERIIARVFAKTPADAAGDQLDTFATKMAEKNNVAQHGALVLYFQDQQRWLIRVAPESQERFMAGPMRADGTRDPKTARPNVEQAMADFMAFVALPTPAATTAPTTRRAGTTSFARRISYVLDNLIFRLEPGLTGSGH